MTLPSIIQKNTEKATVSKLKKAYSTLSQAYLSVLSSDGSPDEWNLPDRDIEGGGIMILEKFSPYLKIIKNCGTHEKGCYSEGNSDTQGNTAAKAILGDGSALSVKVWSSECGVDYGTIKQLQNMCAILEIDVNGLKPPNAHGIDRFRFFLTKTSVYPYGTALQNSMSGDELSNISFPFCAKNKGGLGCTAWVLYNENMDYLHCSDLSWTGKTKCK